MKTCDNSEKLAIGKNNEMNPKEYHIIIYSISRFVVAFIVIMCALFQLSDYLPWSKNKIMIVVNTLVVLFSSFYLANLIGRAKAKIIFTQEAFLHIWERKFMFSFEKAIKIPWNIIDNYVFQEDRFFDSFIINLTTNRKYRVNRLNIFSIKDDFDDFRESFPDLANRYRSQNAPEGEVETIEKGESFYATKEFRWIYYIMAIIFILIVIFSIISFDSITNLGNLAIIACALAFYGIMIKANKKK